MRRLLSFIFYENFKTDCQLSRLSKNLQENKYSHWHRVLKLLLNYSINIVNRLTFYKFFKVIYSYMLFKGGWSIVGRLEKFRWIVLKPMDALILLVFWKTCYSVGTGFYIFSDCCYLRGNWNSYSSFLHFLVFYS